MACCMLVANPARPQLASPVNLRACCKTFHGGLHLTMSSPPSNPDSKKMEVSPNCFAGISSKTAVLSRILRPMPCYAMHVAMQDAIKTYVSACSTLFCNH